jgi:hypothetical protein
MMEMGDMADRCMDEMGSMMGGGMMGNSLWLVVVLLAIFLVWLVGLGAVGALIFWGVLGRQEALQAARIETPGGRSAAPYFGCMMLTLHNWRENSPTHQRKW